MHQQPPLFKVTFLDHVPMSDIVAFRETDFMGCGKVWRDNHSDRTLYLGALNFSYAEVKAQLTLLQVSDGAIRWVELT